MLTYADVCCIPVCLVVAAAETLPVGAVVSMAFAPLGFERAPPGCRIGFVRCLAQERQTGLSKSREHRLMHQFT
jgi:hypothetical protein